MQSIRESCGLWAKSTFKEALLKTKDLSRRIRADSLQCFDNLEISGEKVSGYACEGLPKTEEGHTGVDIKYTDVFHELYESGKFSPVRYLAELVNRYKEKGGRDNRLDGFIARGLRTLTSLMREPDFAGSIASHLSVRGKPAKVELNPKRDARDHTDVLLTYGGDLYRIWLFQFSDRGLPHDIERVTGRRGEIPSGIHVLCPLRTEYAIEYERIDSKYQRIKSRMGDTDEELENCSERAVKTRERLTHKLETLKDEAGELEYQFKEIAARTSLELDIIEGWYFYSASHVRRVANLIQSKKEVHSYKKVVKTLLGAEQFLSETRIFNKS